MDLRKLKTLIELVQNSGISELEISEGEEKIRIAKHLPTQQTTMVSMPMANAAGYGNTMHGEHAAAAVSPAPTSAAASNATAEVDTGHKLKAPMVGTFYRASGPDSPSFVEVDKRLKPDKPSALSKP